jgi:hypothetical protein
MKRAVLVLAILLAPATALGQRIWQDAENTNGYVTVTAPSVGTACFLYQTAAFDIQCYTTIPSDVITVPNGVLEGVAGAITGYTAVSGEVQVGAVSGGGLRQFTSLTFDGTHLGLGTPSSGAQTTLSGSVSSSLSQLTLAPTGGTAVGNIFNLIPKGAGSFGVTSAVFLYNTDAIADATNYERLLIEGHGSAGYLFLSGAAGTGAARPIAFDATGVTSTQLALSTGGSVSLGTGDLLMTMTGAQALTKSNGALSVGTTGANALSLKTNGTTAVAIDSAQGVTFPAFSSAGNQCAQFDSTGKIGPTGSPCGSGGLGGASGTVTNVTGTPPIFITGTPSTTPNVTIQGAITSGSTSTTTQNLGSLTTGLLKGTVSAGVNTISTALAGTDYQAPLVACTDYVSLACVTGATDLGGSNATPTVIGIENTAAMRGDIVATEISAPANPAANHLACWADFTTENWNCKKSLGTINHGTQDYTCSTHQFANHEGNSGATSCAQPDFTDLTGAASCSQLPSFTGDVANAACFTKVVGVTDGSGVDWPTSGTWANAQVLTTSSGHITAASTIACSMEPSFTGDVANAGCFTKVVGETDGAGVDWTNSGTWANGQILQTSSGHVTAATSVACGNLPALTGGVTTPGGSCATTLDGASVAAATTKLTYSLQLQLGSNTPNTWLLEGGPGLWANSAVIEYPNNFKASRIQVIWYLRSNTVLTGTLSLFAAMNGAGIGGTGFAITSATAAGVHVGTNLPTSSTSSSDTYGLVFTTDNLFSSASPSAAFVTVEVMLMP